MAASDGAGHADRSALAVEAETVFAMRASIVLNLPMQMNWYWLEPWAPSAIKSANNSSSALAS
jgi:hypothetical protein